MLRGAGRTFYLVKSSDVLVRSWFQNSPNSNCCVSHFVQILNNNGRPYSFVLKGLQDSGYMETSHVAQLHTDKRVRILALIKRIRAFQARINDRKKDRLTKKSKIVLDDLLLVLNDLEKALRELRQLL